MSKDNIKNVNRKQCFGTIFCCIIMLCALFIPVAFNTSGVVFTYKALPFIGDETIMTPMFDSCIQGIQSVYNNPQILEIFSKLIHYSTLAFFAICALDIVLSLILIITGSEILRFVFKVVSIVLAFVMLAIALINILCVAGIALCLIKGIVEISSAGEFLKNSGIILFAALIILAFIMMGKQFKWYAKLF